MTIIDGFLPDFDREMGTTRRLLERVPLARGDWTPHPKSFTLVQLATHIVQIPGRISLVLATREWDRAEPRPAAPVFTEIAQLLDAFDGHVSGARADLVDKIDGELLVPWKLKQNGRDLFSLPRIGILRFIVLHHMIHHRGQLSVYLRMQDVPLPSMYGPSADEAV